MLSFEHGWILQLTLGLMFPERVTKVIASDLLVSRLFDDSTCKPMRDILLLLAQRA